MKIEVTAHGEREWVSADAMDRQVKRADVAEAERDKLVAETGMLLAMRRPVGPDPRTARQHYLPDTAETRLALNRLEKLLDHYECKGGDDGDED